MCEQGDSLTQYPRVISRAAWGLAMISGNESPGPESSSPRVQNGLWSRCCQRDKHGMNRMRYGLAIIESMHQVLATLATHSSNESEGPSEPILGSDDVCLDPDFSLRHVDRPQGPDLDRVHPRVLRVVGCQRHVLPQLEDRRPFFRNANAVGS